jgi:hypothetical protein
MTIDEAIRLLNGFLDGPGKLKADMNRQAIKLGIEALKRCKRAYDYGEFMPVYPLEGESRDEY